MTISRRNLFSTNVTRTLFAVGAICTASSAFAMSCPACSPRQCEILAERTNGKVITDSPCTYQTGFGHVASPHQVVNPDGKLVLQKGEAERQKRKLQVSPASQ